MRKEFKTMPHFCALCGTERDPRDRVCRGCGQKITETQALAPRGNRQRVVWTLSAGVTAVALVGIVGWAVSPFWRGSPGGEIAFQQHNRAGNAAFERGDFTDADTEYSAMIALRPRRIDGYLLRAINDYKAGLMPQAIRDNTSALALHPPSMQSAGLYFNRAEAYSNRRDWAKAIADYTASEQAYRQASTEPGGYDWDRERLPGWLAECRRGRARANLQLKNYAQTCADYSANIKAGTILPEDYGMRATAEAGLGHDAAAIADYGQSLCIDPGYLYGFQGVDRVVTRSHQYAQAVTAFRQVTQAQPENVLGWGSLGWYEHTVGHLPAAIAADEKALALDPQQGWIRYNLGLSYAVAGDSIRAREAYAAALASHGNADREASFKELQKAQSQHPDSPALKSALQQMQAAIAADPKKPTAPTAGGAAQPAPPVDPAFERLLAADTKQHGYAIRPPAGYTVKQKESVTLSGGQSVDYWQGASRPDKSAPDLQVEIITDDGRLAAHSSPKQMVQEYLDGLADNHTQMNVSAITPCTLRQRTFMKATWSGIGAKTGKQFHGFVYIASQTGEYISLVAHDTAPYDATSLPLLEASVRTFRR